jgi:predicted nucleic acid-binding protein
MFVVDNSVVMAWCFEDEASPYTEGVLDQLRQTQAVVPAIWPLEVANVLLSAERRDRLNEAQTAHFAQLLRELPILVEEVDIERILGPVLSVGRAHRLSSYDAAYLELAARQGLPLATQDARLRKAAGSAGVAILH